MVTQATTGTQAVPETPRVKVQVTITAGAHLATIKSSHSYGNIYDICQCIHDQRKNREAYNHAAAGYGLAECIYRTRNQITATEWANAIAEEIMRRTVHNTGTAEMKSLINDTFLATDDGIYRLIPVESAPHSKAMGAIKRKIKEKAEAEAASIVKVANDQATVILNKASASHETAKRELAEARTARRAAPPKWMIDYGVPCKNLGGYWYAGFMLPIAITKFEAHFAYRTDGKITRREWASVAHNKVASLCWLPLDGDSAFNPRAVLLDTGNLHQLPHIAFTGACLDVGDVPKKINNNTDFKVWVAAFTRVMQMVDLSSLLCMPMQWPPDLRKAVPPELEPILKLTNREEIKDFVSKGTKTDLKPTKQETVTAEEAQAETWRTTP